MFAANIPLHRLGTPEDVGAAAVYLASPEASWMTGQVLNLNGGSVTS
ncbi:SDR family oxidoreductase [Streptomyces globisporus]